MREIVNHLFVFDKSTGKEEFEFVLQTLEDTLFRVWPEAFVFSKQKLTIVGFDYFSSPDARLTVGPWDGSGDPCVHVSDFWCKPGLPKALLNSYRLRRAIRNIPGFSVSQKKRVLKVRMVDREFELGKFRLFFPDDFVSNYVYQVYKTKESLK